MANKPARYHFWEGLIAGTIFINTLGWMLHTVHILLVKSVKNEYTLYFDIAILLFAAFVGLTAGALVQNHAKSPVLTSAQLHGTLIAASGTLLVDMLRDHFTAVTHETHHMFMTVLIFFIAGAVYIHSKTTRKKSREK